MIFRKVLCVMSIGFVIGCGSSYPEYPTDVRKAYTEAAATLDRDRANQFVLGRDDYSNIDRVKQLIGSSRWAEISCSNRRFFDVQIKYDPKLFAWKVLHRNHHGTSNKLRALGWEASNCLTYEIISKRSKEHVDEISVFLVQIDGKWKILDE